MRLVSLNTGLPREVMWHGTPVTTGIFKDPVTGPVKLRRLNLEGDRQADLTVHGGKDKAVYVYPVEHYDYWKSELPEHELAPGAFGENFTVESLSESSIHVGDVFAVGSAEVVVTQPRLPCYKLGIKFQSDQMVKRFLRSGRMGFYLAVRQEGEVEAGNRLSLIASDPNAVAVTEITRLYLTKSYNADDLTLLSRVLGVAALPPSWKQYFRERLAVSGTDAAAAR